MLSNATLSLDRPFDADRTFGLWQALAARALPDLLRIRHRINRGSACSEGIRNYGIYKARRLSAPGDIGRNIGGMGMSKGIDSVLRASVRGGFRRNYLFGRNKGFISPDHTGCLCRDRRKPSAGHSPNHRYGQTTGRQGCRFVKGAPVAFWVSPHGLLLY